jgi:hypothetical protein
VGLPELNLNSERLDEQSILNRNSKMQFVLGIDCSKLYPDDSLELRYNEGFPIVTYQALSLFYQSWKTFTLFKPWILFRVSIQELNN